MPDRDRKFTRVPRHVGLIPDGNRRWARQRDLHVSHGYLAGVERGLEMLRDCKLLGIDEVSVYGFTQDNTKRPRDQRIAFAAACVEFVKCAIQEGIALRVLGDTRSAMFPSELLPYATRQGEGLKVNLLVNYGWEWDLNSALTSGATTVPAGIASHDVSRIDMIVRWGGCRRLSGFLPIQSVYADFFVVDELWPDYSLRQFHQALEWFQTQEPTLGG